MWPPRGPSADAVAAALRTFPLAQHGVVNIDAGGHGGGGNGGDGGGVGTQWRFDVISVEDEASNPLTVRDGVVIGSASLVKAANGGPGAVGGPLAFAWNGHVIEVRFCVECVSAHAVWAAIVL